MDELIQQALTVLRGMWHRRWIGLAAAWLVAVVGVTVALRVPERNEASARVYVDTQTLLRPLMEGLSIQPNIDQQVALLSRTLISRPNIERVVRMADLDLASTLPEARDAIVDRVSRGLRLGAGASNIYTITYQDTNPEQARKVAQLEATIRDFEVLAADLSRQIANEEDRHDPQPDPVFEDRVELCNDGIHWRYFRKKRIPYTMWSTPNPAAQK